MSIKNAFNDKSDPKPMGGKDQFFWYVRRGYVDDAKAFLAATPKAAKWRMKDETALHVAARAGNAAMVGLLIDAGAPVEAPDKNGKTPLLHAAVHNKTDAIEALLSREANINAQDASKSTALMLAVCVNNDACHDAVVLLLSRKARHDIRDGGDCTALHLAAEWGNPKAVEALISAKADMEARNFEGFTPFISACRYNGPAAALALVAAGANTDAEDDEGMTGLGYAREMWENVPGFAANVLDAIETLAKEKRDDIRRATSGGTTRNIRKRKPIKFGDK